MLGNTLAIAPDATASETTGPRDLPLEGEVGSDFVALFETHFARVVRALELGGLDHASAEDAAQEAFARTLGHWKRVRLGTNPPGYVFRTAFRLARRQLGRRLELELDPERHESPDSIGSVATRLDVEAVLSTLPPRRRACAVACLVVGLSTGEAARALGIAPGTVRKQLELARAELRAALGEDASGEM